MYTSYRVQNNTTGDVLIEELELRILRGMSVDIINYCDSDRIKTLVSLNRHIGKGNLNLVVAEEIGDSPVAETSPKVGGLDHGQKRPLW